MAAAAGLVWVTLLMCVALGAGQIPTASLFSGLVPQGSLPPPVRIYCKQKAQLNVAIVDGDVVLANAKCNDWSQKWYPVYDGSTLFNGQIELKPFSLVNALTFQVITITIPSGSSQKVGLSRQFDLDDLLRAAREELWLPEKPTGDDGFYRLFVNKNTAFTLNGLGGGVTVGTKIGIYSGPSDTENALWQLTSYPHCGP